MKYITLTLLLILKMTGYATTPPKIIYGYVEKATLVDTELTLSAKLDTGAKSASLSAINIQPTKKDGRTWLTFAVPSKKGEIRVAGEYVGDVHIKARSLENSLAKPDSIKRPVVLLRIRMGEIEQTLHVNLTNRKRFIYPLLLGRDAINAFSGLVDPSAAFLLNRSKKDKSHEI